MTILFTTKLRKNLLTYSFTHADERFYVRELANLINEDVGNLSRELRKLEKEGLYVSFSKGNIKFYSLNKSYPLFKELKQIVFKTEGVEGSLRDLVHKYKAISLAFIYGSYAKNKEKKTSDIDIAVVGEFPRNEFTRDIKNLESKLNRDINFSSYNKEEFLKEKMKLGSFLNLVLKDKVIILKGRVDVE
ncbi:MAG: nucleotidyltransferase domain-containing protein [Candidatus Omnitrophota bacterium]